MRGSMMLVGLLKFGPESCVTLRTVFRFRMLKMFVRMASFYPLFRLNVFSKRMSS